MRLTDCAGMGKLYYSAGSGNSQGTAGNPSVSERVPQVSPDAAYENHITGGFCGV